MKRILHFKNPTLTKREYDFILNCFVEISEEYFDQAECDAWRPAQSLCRDARANYAGTAGRRLGLPDLGRRLYRHQQSRHFGRPARRGRQSGHGDVDQPERR